MVDEPQSASEYTDRTTQAVKSVLIEIGQTLGSYEGKFAVIGGAVPWLLLDEANDMRHIGTLDIDLSLNADALAKDDEYAGLVEALHAQGYVHRGDDGKAFQMERTYDPNDGGGEIKVIVDFLRPYDAVLEKNKPPITPGFATQRAFGADLATSFFEMVALEGAMPRGGTNKVMIAVASIPALLAMKGYAIHRRLKGKDAYDIYYSIRNYPGGPEALAECCKPLLEHRSAQEGYAYLVGKFRNPDDFGPTQLWKFVSESEAAGDRNRAEWQQDGFGQVDVWAKLLGLR